MSWIQGLSARTIQQALNNGDFLPHQVEEAQRRLAALTVDRPRTLIPLGSGAKAANARSDGMDRPRGTITLR